MSGSLQVVIRQSSKKNTNFPSFFYFSFIPKILRYDLMFADWSTYLVDRKFKMMTNFTFATKTNPPLIEGTVYIKTVTSRDAFELEFSGSSEPELLRFRAEPSRAGAL